MTRRIKLTIAYDGTEYHGWQIQPNAVTIEEVLNRAVSNATGENIQVIGASRTDSGVHAKGNVAVFDTDCTIPTDKFPVAINQKLPKDIVITSACEVDAQFHPRYADVIKTYEYTIMKGKIADPLRQRYACYHYYDLDVEKMKQGLGYLTGTHDFASFCSTRSDVGSTVRTIYSIDVTESDKDIVFKFTGDGFLYHMIRIIMGISIKIGDGCYPPQEMKNVLDKCERGYGRPTAPANGLCLISIEYKDTTDC